MYVYLLKRLLFFIPTLLLISIASFLLSVSAPGDPTDKLMQLDNVLLEKSDYEREYRRIAKNLHQNKPLFYFSLLPLNVPVNLRSRIIQQDERNLFMNHLYAGRKMSAIEQWLSLIDNTLQSAEKLEGENDVQKKSLLNYLYELRNLSEEVSIRIKMSYGSENFHSILDIQTFEKSFLALVSSETKLKFIPVFHWNGRNNQYHMWMKSLFVPASNISIKDGRPVMDKVSSSLGWTLSLLIIALLLSLTIAVPAGVYSAAIPDSFGAKFFEKLSFALYAIPVFWLATICMVLFTTGYYGMKIFPSVGLFPVSSDQGVFGKMWSSFPKLILPIFCLVLHSLSFVSRQIKLSMEKELGEAYILTAKAKGLSKSRILWRHAFLNASIPLITLITGSIPALVAGTLIIEVVFNIPGMGRLMFDSLVGKDWPVVFTVVHISGIITVISYLLADIAYAVLDPRIKY